MSTSHKRKRESQKTESEDHERHYILGLEAHEAVVQAAVRQRAIKLSTSKPGEVTNSGLIE